MEEFFSIRPMDMEPGFAQAIAARRKSHNSIIEQIGNTPLLRIRNLARGHAKVLIYAKAEWFNPGGSVKDRPALRMIEEAEKTGALTKDKTLIDSTSGNTGIAYAMIGAVKGYRVELVMPKNVSHERIKIATAYGAKLILSSPFEGSDGAIRLCRRIFSENPDKYFWPDQYNNPENWRAHYYTTGEEIIEQTGGRITHFVAGIGTGGTVMGVLRRLKEFNSEIKVIAVEPDNPLHGIEGLKHMDSSIVPSIYDESLLDDKINVKTEDAYQTAKLLAKAEGLMVGFSSGAAMAGALEVASRIGEGLIVTIFADGGDKYLSSALW